MWAYTGRARYGPVGGPLLSVADRRKKSQSARVGTRQAASAFPLRSLRSPSFTGARLCLLRSQLENPNPARGETAQQLGASPGAHRRAAATLGLIGCW